MFKSGFLNRDLWPRWGHEQTFVHGLVSFRCWLL